MREIEAFFEIAAPRHHEKEGWPNHPPQAIGSRILNE
jgi:hypothetical protein